MVFIDELGVMAKQMEQPASTGGPDSAEYDVRLLLVETGRHVAGPLALWLLLGSELL